MFFVENDMYKTKLKFILSIITFFLVTSCSNNAPAPVVDLNTKHKIKSASFSRLAAYNTEHPQSHVVKAGDTLFSIAWRYSLDYKVIAKNNRLKNYRIYPGQQLQLMDHNDDPIFSVDSLVSAINREILNKPEVVNRATGTAFKTTTQRKSVKSSKRQRALVHQSKSRQKQVASQQVRTHKRSSNSSIKRWIWPVSGKIINHFSAKLNQNKGVDIAAKKGDAVRATAKGHVVYSGNGLRGYGRLVIIKHNDNYLSAYAHNNKIHVEQNEFVKAGQRIADIGSSGANREKLHFEIRYKGKPVDPLNYLPKTGLL